MKRRKLSDDKARAVLRKRRLIEPDNRSFEHEPSAGKQRLLDQLGEKEAAQ